MSFHLAVPLSNGQSLPIALARGEYLVAVGANGTGKSSLMHRFYTMHRAGARQISAHRQTWFSSGAVTLSPQDKRNTEAHIQNIDVQPQARWSDTYAAQRASIAIYDLIDAENVRARAIAGAVDQANLDLAQQLAKKDAPIKVINELLRLSNLPIEISVRESEQVMASKAGGPLYSIAELSDGERNAVLVAANVLTVKPDTLVLIDEPERHLHRSITSPLLTLLFARRPDCAFVVSTHDVTLPLDNPTAQVLLVRNCTYSGSSVTAWDADLVAAGTGVEEELKRDILGARRAILFVEGTASSLDTPLYSLLFPGVSVVPKDTCRDVEHAVAGIRGAGDLHWLRAFGLVDGDHRAADDRDRLRQRGVYALDAYAVESVYYHPTLQQRVAERHARVTGADAHVLVAAANAALLCAVVPHADRLCQRVAEKATRAELFRHLPRRKDMTAAGPISITIDVPALVATERARFDSFVAAGDGSGVISRYPVRETPALDRVAAALGFQDRAQYEGAVRTMLMDDADALRAAVSLFGTLAGDVRAT